MGVRDHVRRIKRSLRGSSNSSKSSSSSSTLSKSGSSSSACTALTWPDQSIVYQPGEKMPTPKYRRTPNKEHTAKLHAFDFATAWKDKSQVSLYSPMGSRMPSRRNSMSHGRSFREGRVRMVMDESADTDSDYTAVNSSDTGSTVVVSRPHSEPFNVEDLTLALQRSHI